MNPASKTKRSGGSPKKPRMYYGQGGCTDHRSNPTNNASTKSDTPQQQAVHDGMAPKNDGEMPGDLKAFFGHPLVSGGDNQASALALLHEYQNLPAIDHTDNKIKDKYDGFTDILSKGERSGVGGEQYSLLMHSDVDAFLNLNSSGSAQLRELQASPATVTSPKETNSPRSSRGDAPGMLDASQSPGKHLQGSPDLYTDVPELPVHSPPGDGSDGHSDRAIHQDARESYSTSPHTPGDTNEQSYKRNSPQHSDTCSPSPHVSDARTHVQSLSSSQKRVSSVYDHANHAHERPFNYPHHRLIQRSPDNLKTDSVCYQSQGMETSEHLRNSIESNVHLDRDTTNNIISNRGYLRDSMVFNPTHDRRLQDSPESTDRFIAEYKNFVSRNEGSSEELSQLETALRAPSKSAKQLQFSDQNDGHIPHQTSSATLDIPPPPPYTHGSFPNFLNVPNITAICRQIQRDHPNLAGVPLALIENSLLSVGFPLSYPNATRYPGPEVSMNARDKLMSEISRYTSHDRERIEVSNNHRTALDKNQQFGSQPMDTQSSLQPAIQPDISAGCTSRNLVNDNLHQRLETSARNRPNDNVSPQPTVLPGGLPLSAGSISDAVMQPPMLPGGLSMAAHMLAQQALHSSMVALQARQHMQVACPEIPLAMKQPAGFPQPSTNQAMPGLVSPHAASSSEMPPVVEIAHKDSTIFPNAQDHRTTSLQNAVPFDTNLLSMMVRNALFPQLNVSSSATTPSHVILPKSLFTMATQGMDITIMQTNEQPQPPMTQSTSPVGPNPQQKDISAMAPTLTEYLKYHQTGMLQNIVNLKGSMPKDPPFVIPPSLGDGNRAHFQCTFDNLERKDDKGYHESDCEAQRGTQRASVRPNSLPLMNCVDMPERVQMPPHQLQGIASSSSASVGSESDEPQQMLKAAAMVTGKQAEYHQRNLLLAHAALVSGRNPEEIFSESSLNKEALSLSKSEERNVGNTVARDNPVTHQKGAIAATLGSESLSDRYNATIPQHMDPSSKPSSPLDTYITNNSTLPDQPYSLQKLRELHSQLDPNLPPLVKPESTNYHPLPIFNPYSRLYYEQSSDRNFQDTYERTDKAKNTSVNLYNNQTYRDLNYRVGFEHISNKSIPETSSRAEKSHMLRDEPSSKIAENDDEPFIKKRKTAKVTSSKQSKRMSTSEHTSNIIAQNPPTSESYNGLSEGSYDRIVPTKETHGSSDNPLNQAPVLDPRATHTRLSQEAERERGRDVSIRDAELMLSAMQHHRFAPQPTPYFEPEVTENSQYRQNSLKQDNPLGSYELEYNHSAEQTRFTNDGVLRALVRPSVSQAHVVNQEHDISSAQRMQQTHAPDEGNSQTHETHAHLNMTPLEQPPSTARAPLHHSGQSASPTIASTTAAPFGATSEAETKRRRSLGSRANVTPQSETRCGQVYSGVKMDAALCAYRIYLDTPISASQKLEDDRITYVNKGQFYNLIVEYKNKLRPLPKATVKTVVMVLFRDDRSVPDEWRAWQFWQSRQSSPRQRVLAMELKESEGVIETSSEETAYNAYTFQWDPVKSSLKVGVSINCLSTDFSNQKGVKGLPLHIQVDTYEEDSASPSHRAYCQVKVFCDKGAERKTRDEVRKARNRPSTETGEKPITSKKNKAGLLLHPPCEISEFYDIADLRTEPVLFDPYKGAVKQDSPPPRAIVFPTIDPKLANVASSSIPPQNSHVSNSAAVVRPQLNVTPSTRQTDEKVLLYVRERHESVFTALLLLQPTLRCLLQAINEKYDIPAENISNIYKRSRRGILVKMDDNIVRHYANESTFLITLQKLDTREGTIAIYDVTLEDLD